MLPLLGCVETADELWVISELMATSLAELLMERVCLCTVARRQTPIHAARARRARSTAHSRLDCRGCACCNVARDLAASCNTPPALIARTRPTRCSGCASRATLRRACARWPRRALSRHHYGPLPFSSTESAPALSTLSTCPYPEHSTLSTCPCPEYSTLSTCPCPEHSTLSACLHQCALCATRPPDAPVTHGISDCGCVCVDSSSAQDMRAKIAGVSVRRRWSVTSQTSP